MTEMTPPPSPANGIGTAAGKANQIWGDFIPVIGFILTYNVFRRVELLGGLINKDTAIYWATGVLIVLMLGFLGKQIIERKPVSQMMVFSSAIVGGFGLIGILLQEKAFIYVKPTIQQIFMAGMIFIPLLFGKNLWKTLFSKVFDLPDFAWRTLAIRWGLFFIAMAFWNEYLWRTYAPGFESPLVLAGIPVAPAGTYEFLGLTFGAKNAEDVWANWKLGNMVIVFLFGALNTPYTLKHLRTDEAPPETA
ncbi:putative intracellular septation protein A [Hyphomonas polymorpha PS728]|uniref:Inner membrane-spanning protein YciB n=1 Tax=Hyphomonas polymorpha PS728 TaxID=1280954 RepID=A0A062VJG9_9PROT|nr:MULTISPECIES: septation protein IspZ [Hyphomonas]KCZ98725.1 putative intracellular septation protein A [Hyphomonas polymorpha PS728]